MRLDDNIEIGVTFVSICDPDAANNQEQLRLEM